MSPVLRVTMAAGNPTKKKKGGVHNLITSNTAQQTKKGIVKNHHQGSDCCFRPLSPVQHRKESLFEYARVNCMQNMRKVLVQALAHILREIVFIYIAEFRFSLVKHPLQGKKKPFCFTLKMKRMKKVSAHLFSS